MKKFLFQAVLLIVVIAAAIFIFKTGPSISGLPFLSSPPSSKQLLVGEAKFRVEIADTKAKREKGLGGRENIASDEGMLFVFEDVGSHPFWMKGLKFPLDFIWIRGDRVVDLTSNALPAAAGQPDSALPIYQSKEDVNKVLEVPAGTIQRLNIKVGDMVRML